MFSIYKKLKSLGVLSLNRRNGDYIMKYNPRSLYQIVDNKLLTKQLAIDAGINVPDLYKVIHSEHDILNCINELKQYADFVIKPAHGSGGKGILIITEQIQDRFRKSNGRLILPADIDLHLSNILSGIYSLAGQPDQALIEARIVKDPFFDAISTEGVPDIRVIVLLGYPAAAMLRLPTYQSEGKANLHQGAIGVGINLSTGETLNGVWFHKQINEHPDTLKPIIGIKIPHWAKVLTLASGFFELTKMGYLGVDIVLDKQKGPVMLELNARPGLNIQIANNRGFLERYRKIETLHQIYQHDISKRVELALEEKY